MLDNDRNKVDLFDAINRGSIIPINTAEDLLEQDGCEILSRFLLPLYIRLYRSWQLSLMIAGCRHLSILTRLKSTLTLTQALKYNVGLIVAHQNFD